MISDWSYLLRYYNIHSNCFLFILGEKESILQKLAEDTLTKIFKHSLTVENHLIQLAIMKMDKSNFIWLGSELNLASLAISMQTPFDTQPTSLQLIGQAKEIENSMSMTISRFLTKQTGGQWVASCNVSVPGQNREFVRSVLEQLKVIVKDNENWFN